MAVPTYDALMLPVLRLAADGREHSQAEAVNVLAAEFHLTPNERTQLLPSGTQPAFYNRVHWARSYLKHSGLLESTARGRFRITELGRQVLASEPSRIDGAFLRQFPAFIEFQGTQHERGTTTRSRHKQGRALNQHDQQDQPTAVTAASSSFPGRAELEAAVLTVLSQSPEGMTSAEMLNALPNCFPHLSPDDLARRTRGGRHHKLRYEGMWARQYLEWRGFVISPRWRHNAITQAGMELIARHRRSDGSVDMTALALRFPVQPRKPILANTPADQNGEEQPSIGPVVELTAATSPTGITNSVMSFADAAEQVIEQCGGKPMHYREIAARATDLGLVEASGDSTGQTLYAQVLNEIARDQRRGQTPRFVKHGRGLLGLSRYVPSGLAAQIGAHNDAVKQRLHDALLTMAPGEFEALIGQLLVKLGFEDVVVTGRSGDGGIDVRGTLVVGSVIRTRMAVQVKRWRSNNVQAPTVQQVRGSLGTHDQGLIIATSDFSPGARSEAQRPNAVPVALMNGSQLVDLLVEHEIGVRRASYDLLELDGQASEDE